MNHSENEIQNVSMERPHLVLIGSGTSLAAFPNGDRNRRKLPLMNDLIQVVGLDGVLSKVGIDYQDRNFEDIYSELYEQAQHQFVIQEIENRIRVYFSAMELPDEPTLYDHLVLSLRRKDVIEYSTGTLFSSRPAREITSEQNFHVYSSFMATWPLDIVSTIELKALLGHRAESAEEPSLHPSCFIP